MWGILVIAKQFPAKKTFSMTHPVCFGIANLPQLSPGLLLISVIVQAHTSPWRTKFANVVELLLTAFLMVRPGSHFCFKQDLLP